MAGKIKGITIEFDGDVSKLQKSLKEVDKASGKAYRTLKDIDNALKFNPGNTELIAQKQRQLQKQLEASKTKLKALRDADSEMKKQLEAGNLGQDKYDELQREIIESESKIKHFQGEINKLNPSNVEKLASSFDKVGKKLQDVGKKMSSLGKELSTKLTLPLAAIGTISFNNAAELQDALGATEQIYGKAAKEMENWADNLESYYGIAEGKALEYSNTMGAMLKNIGGKSDEEAAKMSQTLVELAGDLSAMFGGTTEEAVNALTGALKGNNSMLDNYGMGVNEATIKTKALEMGLYDGKGAMDLAAKQSATLALIMEQTADAQGQAGREAEGASGSMKSLQTTLSNLTTDIGQVLLPIITPLVQKFTEWVNKFKELDPGIQSFIVKLGLIVTVVGPVLIIFGSLVTAIGAIGSAIGGMIIAMTGAETAMAGFKIALTAIKTNLSGLFAFVSANPIVLIIGAIVAAVALLIANWDWVKAKAIQLGSSISQTWQNIKTATTNIWNGIKTTITNVWNGIKAGVSNSINSVKNTVTNIFGGLKSTVSNIWNGIKNAIETPINKAKEIVSNAINTIKGLFNFKFTWPKLKMPHFSISGSINPFSSDFPPKVGVDWYAQGGIFDKPSIIGVGEAGEEVLLPTHKLDKFLEEAVSRVSGQGQGSGITINIENAVVREESDIRRIAEEVNRLFEVKKNRFRSAGGIA